MGQGDSSSKFGGLLLWKKGEIPFKNIRKRGCPRKRYPRMCVFSTGEINLDPLSPFLVVKPSSPECQREAIPVTNVSVSNQIPFVSQNMAQNKKTVSCNHNIKLPKPRYPGKWPKWDTQLVDLRLDRRPLRLRQPRRRRRLRRKRRQRSLWLRQRAPGGAHGPAVPRGGGRGAAADRMGETWHFVLRACFVFHLHVFFVLAN